MFAPRIRNVDRFEHPEANARGSPFMLRPLLHPDQALAVLRPQSSIAPAIRANFATSAGAWDLGGYVLCTEPIR